MRISKLLSAQSPARVAVDLLWIGAFVIAVVLMNDRDVLQVNSSGVALELIPGTQLKGLYRQEQRFGTIVDEVQRQENGWRLIQRFALAKETIATVEVELRADLSMTALKLQADLSAVLGMLGGAKATKLLKSSAVLRRFVGGKVELSGSCDPIVGSCRIRGTTGEKKVDRLIKIGRGPVLAAAIHPLLARGVIGQEAELTIFDPLQMRTRAVIYKVRGTKRIKLRSSEVEAIEVDQDLDGIISKVWLDRRGRVMLEKLPLGVRIEHESWSDAVDTPKKPKDRKEASKP